MERVSRDEHTAYFVDDTAQIFEEYPFGNVLIVAEYKNVTKLCLSFYSTEYRESHSLPNFPSDIGSFDIEMLRDTDCIQPTLSCLSDKLFR
jgi:hypothetical protein